jgi:MbtH protein
MGGMSEDPAAEPYRVVVNDEGHCSIWPVHKPEPQGWRAAGREGTNEECLAVVRSV